MTVDDIIADVIRREGGFSNHPKDRGGPTQWGITAATLGEHRGLRRDATMDEVQALTIAEAHDIYLTRYVVRPNIHKLPEWLRPMVVDDAVLSGPKAAIRTLQAALGVARDGVIGPRTIAAAMGVTDELRQAMVVRLVRARALRLAGIVRDKPDQSVFIVGWLTRVLSFLDAA